MDILLGVFSSIEMANNEKIHMPALLKYVEVTGLPFKVQLEDGRVIAVSSVPKGRKSRKSVLRKPVKPRTKVHPSAIPLLRYQPSSLSSANII